MNILFLSFIPVIPYYGGIQRVTDILATELDNRGYNIFYLYYEYRELPQNYQSKFSQYYLNVNNRNESDYLREWKEYLEKNDIEVIINQNADLISCKLLYYAPKRIKKITINHLQPFAGLDYQRIIQLNSKPISVKGNIYKLIGIIIPAIINYIERKVHSKRIKKAISVSNLYCVLSHRYIERIKKYDNTIDVSKCISIPNPIKNEGKFNIEKKEKIVLYVGRLVNYPKNVISLLKSWKTIQKQQDWRLVIVGDGPDKSYLEHYCKKEKLRNVSFEGNQEDVASYYIKSSFICITSYNESWAMSLVEGMCFGAIPVAFNSYEAAATIIDDNINGLLIKPFSYKEMSYKIIEVISTPAKMINMMKCAYVKSKKFSVNKVVDEWEKYLKNEN